MIGTSWRETCQVCPGASGLVPWEGGRPQVEEHQPVALDTCSCQTCRYLEGGDTGHGYTAESVVQQQRPYRAQDWAGHRICGRKTDGNTPPPPPPGHVSRTRLVGPETGPFDHLLCDLTNGGASLCLFSTSVAPRPVSTHGNSLPLKTLSLGC